jgi:hypothetical protein
MDNELMIHGTDLLVVSQTIERPRSSGSERGGRRAGPVA